MPGFRYVSFLSDYGVYDGFVAICRAAVLERAPGVQVLDITHQVPPQDVRRGAAVLSATVPDLPPAVHLAVVDPGVGGRRRAVAVRAGGSVLVGPDNGLLPAAADALGGPEEVVALGTAEWFRAPLSATFHGRDIFAPVAGRLAAGAALADAGEAVDPDTLVRLPAPVSTIEADRLTAEVVDVDGFGNAALAADAGAAAALGLRPGTRLRIGVEPGAGSAETAFGWTFADVAVGAPLLYLDSAGRLAVAVRNGSAAATLGLRPGSIVTVIRR